MSPPAAARLRSTTRATAARLAIATLLGAGLPLSITGAEASSDPRQKISINSGWSFRLDTAGGAAAWQAVDLPHSWNAADSRDKTAPYHRGVGRYRKTLYIASSLAGRKLYLYFEGANQVADISVNGRPAGGHVGGYSGFAVDVSDRVRFGERNDIEVRVDNRHDDDVPPLDADFTFYGGIYRDVWLLVVDEVHFELDDHAATNVRVGTTALSESLAKLTIDAGIANRSGRERSIVIDSSIVDSKGSVVAQDSLTTTLEAGSVSRHRLAALEIEAPELWSPESPYLYHVICTIREGEQVLDRVQYPLGLRRLEFDAQSGFRLNGKPYRLFGTNRHQDYPGLGNALPDELHRGDLEKIKADGFNFLRLAHYPQDPAVLEAADELGLLVWEEIPIVNLISLTPAFRRNSARMLREMIRQHRHHPSVAFWGYMNEVTLRRPDPPPDGYYEAVVALAAELDAIAREEDPSRPTVMALSYDELDDGVPLETIPDLLGLNLYFGWYYGEFETLGEFLDRYHADHPDIALFISEYGAGSDQRLHALRPARFDFTTEYQQRFHEQSFAQIRARPWLIGSAVWNQFDFGSSHRQDTLFGINQKGLWYYDRRPKDIAWFYRSQLSAEPVLHIAARDWPRRAGSRPGDAVMPIRVYSNEPSVQLSANGRSLGSKTMREGIAVWDVPFRPGDNVLSARSANREDRVIVAYEDRSSLFTDDPRPVAVLAVNAGGNEQFIDRHGLIWEADRPYAAGSWGYLGGESERSHHRIFGTDDDPLYQTRRLGSHAYQFDVPDGDYLIEFHLARLTDAGGDGSFRVDVDGLAAVVPDPPPFTPRQIALLVAASGGRGLTIQFVSESAPAFVNGIVVRRTGASPAAATE